MTTVLLIICVVAILFYILWRGDQHREHKLKLLSDEWEKERLSDDAVIKAQTKFESWLEEEIDLPDAIRWRNAFIYWRLMRGWFSSLLASSRYTGASDKIKSDWLEYMGLIEQRARVNFLSAETEKEEKSKEYGEEVIELGRKIKLIKDGMAAAVGQKAVAQLEDVRKARHDAFDRSGKKPMAPIGFHYFPTSIQPYVEELRRDNQPPTLGEPKT
jgi:hypothetical protein